MWARQVILAVIGLSSGIAVAGGLFSFIIGLGVVSDFADRTHTGANVILYEEMIALGGILGNIMYVYQICHSRCTVSDWSGWILCRHFCRVLVHGTGRNFKYFSYFYPAR